MPEPSTTQTPTKRRFDWARHGAWLAAVGLLVLALLARVFDLGSMLTVDGVAHWSQRIARFWDGLAEGDFKKTFQPHPGVTLMWFSGLSLKLAGKLHAGPDASFIVPAKLPIAVFGALLAPLSFLLLRRILKHGAWLLPLLAGLFIATEPFLVRTSRSLHVDNFAVGFGWLAVLCAIVTFEERSRPWAVVAGLMQGLALLSRTSTGPIALGIGLWWLIHFIRSRGKDHASTTLLLIIAAVALVTFVVGWPALLFEPVYVVNQMMERTGLMLSKGHRLFFMGELYSKDPGPLYYVVLVWMRVAPETLIALLVGAVAAFWRPVQRGLLLKLVVMYSLFIIMIALTGKKTNRYIMPILPVFCVLAAMGWTQLLDWLKHRLGAPRGWQATAVIVGLLLVGRSTRLLQVHPLPSSWCASYPGVRCEEWITLGGGQGLREVALFIKDYHKQSKQKYPGLRGRPRVFPPPHAIVLTPWVKIHRMRSVKQSQYMVDYLSERQRKWGSARLERFRGDQEPLFEVNLDGRNFARVYLGPKHPGYKERGGWVRPKK